MLIISQAENLWSLFVLRHRSFEKQSVLCKEDLGGGCINNYKFWLLDLIRIIEQLSIQCFYSEVKFLLGVQGGENNNAWAKIPEAVGAAYSCLKLATLNYVQFGTVRRIRQKSSIR